MTNTFLTDPEISVRNDLRAAYQKAWTVLAEPGTWWTGRERIAIASEVRLAEHCSFCKERKAALSPFAVKGQHQSDGILSAAAVELIHRITTDPQRIAKSMFEQALEAGITRQQYVELLGVVTTVVGVDTFCKATGLALQ